MPNQNNVSPLFIALYIAIGTSALAIGARPLTAWAHLPSDAERCTTATAQVERSLRLPDGFLSAMSRIETGRPETKGHLVAWPWSVNANGIGYQYNSMQEAVTAVKQFQREGIKSIDVGCLQINLMYHPDAFSSIEAAFDPLTNAFFAGHFLKQMHDKTGSWPRAAAAYHSQTPGIGEAYLWRVVEEWAVPQDGRPTLPPKIISPHTVSTSRMLSSPYVSTKQQSNHIPLHDFKPFKGFQHFSAVPNHKRMSSSMNGRNLASYRSTPVRIVNNMPYPSSY